MATQSIKIYHNATTDGVAYVDMPRAGTIVGIRMSMHLIAGAGGIAEWSPEISRSPGNQVLTNDPRGVLATAFVASAAASQGRSENVQYLISERVGPGDRIYLNCASAANFSSGFINTFIDLQ